jgi:competence protein ComEA
LGGKAVAYVAGFFALALVGSGSALSMLPQTHGGAAAGLAMVMTGPALPAATAPAVAASGVASVDAGAAAPPAEPVEPSADAAGGGVTADGKIVLNLATDADLRRLPGVGPAKAAAILALRAKLKRFRKVEDLLRVKGLGRRSIKRLRPLVLVDPP